MLSNFYYERLDQEAKYAYSQLSRAVSLRQTECQLQCSQQQAVAAWKAFTFDYPQTINYPGLFFNSASPNSYSLYYTDVDENAFNQKLDAVVAEINARLDLNATQYQICKEIYDYIASSVKYEQKVLDGYANLNSSAVSTSSIIDFVQGSGGYFTAYSALMGGRAVCQGISRLFMILCAFFGIECAVVEAVSLNNGCKDIGDHMLNVVEIDGVRAFVDVTNGLMQTQLPVVRYDYFLASKRVINFEYQLFEEFDCVDESINYFVRNGLRFTSLTQLRKYLSRYTLKETGGIVRCWFDSGEIDEEKLNRTVSELNGLHTAVDKFVWPYLSTKKGFCTVMISDDQKLLDRIEKQIKKEKDDNGEQ